MIHKWTCICMSLKWLSKDFNFFLHCRLQISSQGLFSATRLWIFNYSYLVAIFLCSSNCSPRLDEKKASKVSMGLSGNRKKLVWYIMSACIYLCGHCLHKTANASSNGFASVMTPSRWGSLIDEASWPAGKWTCSHCQVWGQEQNNDCGMERKWKSLPKLPPQCPADGEAICMWASAHTEDRMLLRGFYPEESWVSHCP